MLLAPVQRALVRRTALRLTPVVKQRFQLGDEAPRLIVSACMGGTGTETKGVGNYTESLCPNVSLFLAPCLRAARKEEGKKKNLERSEK